MGLLFSNFLKKSIFRLAFLFLALGLASCGAVNKSMKHGKMEVQTKMSDTIFLDPVEDREKTIYVQIRNTSDKQNVQIDQNVKHLLALKGYRIVNDTKDAKFILQANVLQVGKNNLEDPFDSMGYSSALQTAALGSVVGAATVGNTQSVVVGGIMGG